MIWKKLYWTFQLFSSSTDIGCCVIVSCLSLFSDGCKSGFGQRKTVVDKHAVSQHSLLFAQVASLPEQAAVASGTRPLGIALASKFNLPTLLWRFARPFPNHAPALGGKLTQLTAWHSVFSGRMTNSDQLCPSDRTRFAVHWLQLSLFIWLLATSHASQVTLAI